MFRRKPPVKEASSSESNFHIELFIRASPEASQFLRRLCVVVSCTLTAMLTTWTLSFPTNRVGILIELLDCLSSEEYEQCIDRASEHE